MKYINFEHILSILGLGFLIKKPENTLNKYVILSKVDRVFNSCTTSRQWLTAYKYYRLAKKKFPQTDWDDFEDIYRKYHSKSYIYATESHNEQN
jgi:hypothetical protein